MGIQKLEFKDGDDGDIPVGLELIVSVVENGYLIEMGGDKHVFLSKTSLLNFLKENL